MHISKKPIGWMRQRESGEMVAHCAARRHRRSDARNSECSTRAGALPSWAGWSGLEIGFAGLALFVRGSVGGKARCILPSQTLFSIPFADRLTDRADLQCSLAFFCSVLVSSLVSRLSSLTHMHGSLAPPRRSTLHAPFALGRAVPAFSCLCSRQLGRATAAFVSRPARETPP